MKLSQQQLNLFRDFGFLVFRQLLTAQEMAQYSRDFNAGLDSWLENGKHDGKSRHYGSLMEEQSPFVAGLADDHRFADVAEQLLGKDVIAIAVDGNYHVDDTLWHPDTRSLNYAAVKFCIYPDPLNGSNGALRVIPGSHLDPFHSQISREPEATYDLAQADVPAYTFESQPGDVLAFNVALWHAAFGGGNQRRQGVVVYYEDPDTPEATAAIQEQMRGNHKAFAQAGRKMYGRHWRSIDDRRHQRWIRRLAELDVLETEF
jgi:hypothetical protein